MNYPIVDFYLEPETKSATLMNSMGRWTRHHFVRTERRDIQIALKRRDTGEYYLSPTTGKVFIFECAETGEERIWGCQ